DDVQGHQRFAEGWLLGRSGLSGVLRALNDVAGPGNRRGRERGIGCGGVRTPVRGTDHARGQYRVFVRDGGKRIPDLPRISELWREDSAKGPDRLAEIAGVGGMVGRWTSVAPDLYVDLHRHRLGLRGL